jgi:hypothetical protein
MRLRLPLPRPRVVQIKRSPSLLGGGDHQLRGVTVSFRDFSAQAAFLRKMVDGYSKDRSLRELAVSIITACCESRDKKCQALAIGRWVQDHVYYVHEGRETFQTPPTTLRGWEQGQAAGDCDDSSVAVAALLGTVGIKSLLAIIKIAPAGQPLAGRWAHIFPVALIPTRDGIHRLTLDTTLREPIDDMVNPIAKVQASGRLVTETKFV